MTSCACLSDKQLDYPELYEIELPQFPPKLEGRGVNLPHPSVIAKQNKEAEEQHELAIQECEDAGGKWEGYLHGDSIRSYSNFYRCWSENEPKPPFDSVIPEETGLLPYVIRLTYYYGADELIGFSRLHPELQQKSDQGETSKQ